uniref:Uncharacterized protein n=1 Tax=Trichuris muris TaxID=70415 RepID=A0A5S6QAQ2_TRIMR
MNLQLQGDNVNLISTKTLVCSFITKLVTFKNNFARGELRLFPKLFEINEEAKIRDEDIDILLAWKSLLGSSIHFQEELVQLQCNEELKSKFKNGYQAFWLQKKIPSLYTRL